MITENIAFISYRRADSTDVTGRIWDRLITAFGKEAVFKDVESIPLGIHFVEHINSTIKNSRVVLAVIGSKWRGYDNKNGQQRLDEPDDFLRLEIEAAIQQQIPVIPLLINGMTMPNEEDLPDSIKRLAFYNGMPVRSDPDFHRDVDDLIIALEELGFKQLNKNTSTDRIDLPTDVSAYLHHGNENTPINQVPFTIGRHSNNSLSLINNSVSKSHASITFSNNKFYLEDLGSTNGVYLIHGEEAIKLHDGELRPLRFKTSFRLGKTDSSPILTFEIGIEDQTLME